jgi:hypothetical protein
VSSTVGDSAPVTGTGDRLGLKPGMVVQELGWDNDTDDELRVAVEDCIDVGGGSIWLLTPKVGRPGTVDAADISEAAPIAGLSQTTTAAVSKDWQATRLVAPKTPA